MEIKGILFDKDGTLIDFFKVWEPAIQPVLQRILLHFQVADTAELENKLMDCLGYRNGHIDPEGAIAWKSYAGITEDMRKVLVKDDIEVEEEQLRYLLTSLFYEEVVEKRSSYPTFTDLPRLMSFLKEHSIHVGLATTDTYVSSRHCLECLGIAEDISFWGTADGELPEKPDGDLIRLAAKQWGILPEEIAVVGDTPNDMRFARNGHALGIGVLSGTGKLKDMSAWADQLLYSVDDLEEWLSLHLQGAVCRYEYFGEQGETNKWHTSV